MAARHVYGWVAWLLTPHGTPYCTVIRACTTHSRWRTQAAETELMVELGQIKSSERLIENHTLKIDEEVGGLRATPCTPYRTSSMC